jgi:NAD+ synthase/NAD+ synthase (glutamine-hydrolysing)
MLRITGAQLNLTIGDIEGNVDRIITAAHTAAGRGSNLVVFPELAVTGYYPVDMLDEPEFMDRVEEGLAQLQQASKDIPAVTLVVGLPLRREGAGKLLQNAMALVKNGEVLGTYAKQLLPTYNIFDERRHFEPGPDVAFVQDIDGHRVGFLICEDGWNDGAQDYAVNPFSRLAEAQPEVVVSINASPSNINKREQRHQVFGAASTHHGLPLVYVNHIGGHDQLVYDGASFAVEPGRGPVFEACRFVEDIFTLDFQNGAFSLVDTGEPALGAPGEVPFEAAYFNKEGIPVKPLALGVARSVGNVDRRGLPTMEFYLRQTVLGLRDYARRCGFKSTVLGESGGIDSALTTVFAAMALGAETVTAITMPSRFSSSGSVSDSEALCRNLGIKLLTHPIKAIVDQYSADFEAATGAAPQGLTLENLQARVRGTILMEYSNAHGNLLLTTGNKSEISVGYCTLYGDTNGGLGLIGDYYKTEVFAEAEFINDVAGWDVIPTDIVRKPPSAELAPGQKDTDSLPPYDVLDDVLKVLIEGARLAPEELWKADTRVTEMEKTEEGRAIITRIKGMIARNEYKRRQAPPILRVRARAFGSGRQMPIAAKYR